MRDATEATVLKIYNTLTRTKDNFVPIDQKDVRMYVCGMTVYDLCHIGHARVLVFFDVVYRYLQALGYPVTYVRNITDIDDKILQRASERAEPWQALTQRFTNAMHRVCHLLSILPPTYEPRATETIPEIIAMIATLIEKGHAYVGDNGDVYYSVDSFPNYGALSGNDVTELRAGERVEIDQHKKDPIDFVLWKSAKLGEPSWPSPWGAGRPGWHIECSAMSIKYLGEHFDVHGGGKDLQFPHHECEIAQSVAATGQPFVNYWLHNGFVRIDDEKMSKSLGNFLTLDDVLKDYHGEVVRQFILSSHYRSPLNFSVAQLDSANVSITRLYSALASADPASLADSELIDTTYRDKFFAVMNDDFNTPQAMAILFAIAKEINSLDKHVARVQLLSATLKTLGGYLGLLQCDPKDWLQASDNDMLDVVLIEQLIAERTQAREAGAWEKSDAIRDQLKSMGVVLEDHATGTSWRKA